MRYEDQIVVVTPYFKHADFREYLPFMTLDDIRHYMFSLFKAICHVHSRSIIHRDLKPSNFLYSVKKKRGLLVDFGLAQTYCPSNKADSSSSINRSTAIDSPFPSPAASFHSPSLLSSSTIGSLCSKLSTNKNLKIVSVSHSSRRAKAGYYVNDTRYKIFLFCLGLSFLLDRLLKRLELALEDSVLLKCFSSILIRHLLSIFGALVSFF